MSTFIRCDGCGAELHSGGSGRKRTSKERLIHGRRDEHSGQGLDPVPDGEFDWCADCAKTAFAAVRDAAGRV